MRITEVKLSKKYKIGLPMYSSMDVGLELTWEVKEGEKEDIEAGFDEINKHLQLQAGSVDPSWITYDEDKKEWKYTIRIPKNNYPKQEKLL